MKKQNEAMPLYIMTLGLLLSSASWFNFSAVLPLVQKEWALTSLQSGNIMGMVQIGYFIAVILAGGLADRIGARKVFLSGTVISGVAGIAFAIFAQGYISGLLLRLMSGIGLGCLYVPGMSYLSHAYSAQKRGAALGLFTGAMTWSSSLSYFLAGSIVSSFSWRWAILATSIIAFPAFLLVLYLVPSKVGKEGGREQMGKSEKLIFKKLQPLVFLIILAYLTHAWELIPMKGWIGPFFSASFSLKGYDLGMATSLGGTAAGLCLFAGAFAPFLGGRLSDKMGRVQSAILFSVLSLVMSFTLGWFVESPTPLVFTLGLVYVFFVLGDSAIYKVHLTEVVDEKHRGLLLGIQSSLGFGLASLPYSLFGYTLDTTGSFGYAFMVLGGGSGVALLFLVTMLFLPRFRQKTDQSSAS